MSGNPPSIEWYIARDGGQHGPISDAEMRKFAELGHLRATDLVWCARFTQWQTGAQAFPDLIPRAAVAAVAPAQPARSAPAPASRPIDSPTLRPAEARTTAASPAEMGHKPLATGASPIRAHQDDAWTQAMSPVVGTATAPSASLEPDSPYEHDDQAEPPPARRGVLSTVTAVVAVLLILGGLGWFAWQNRTLVSGASAISSAITSVVTSEPSSDHLRTAPFVADGDSSADIDASLQKVAVWRYLKREYGSWYKEIVDGVERMRTQRREERDITQFLVDVVVTLRRRNAQTSLQSSPEHLRSMATAFIANLRQLGSRDGATCYAFITHGEASPFMIELSKTPAFAEALQKQMIAVFSAVVDARTNRKVHANTRREDYNTLTEDLTKQRGWSQQDLQTFSDPQKLSMTPPDRVCTLVQDWFVSQLGIKDAELQTRLLAESLKPLVGG